jgi:hypothetical protein
MRKKTCDFEKELIDCLKKETLSPEIKKHVDQCQCCQDIASVHSWMKQYKDMSWNAEVQEKTLPDPEVIWKQAHTIQKPDRELIKKALRPLLYPKMFSFGALILGIIFLFLFPLQPMATVFSPALKIISRFAWLALLPLIIVFISWLFCAFVVALERRKTPA